MVEKLLCHIPYDVQVIKYRKSSCCVTNITGSMQQQQRLPVHLLSHSGYSVSAKCNVNIFWRRKCSVSSEQVSVSRLYPFGLQEEEAALTRPFCPTPPPSCPGGGGSKSKLAAHTHTHTAGLHTRICTCIHMKCCPGECVRW